MKTKRNNNWKKLIVSALLIAMLAFALAACGGSGNSGSGSGDAPATGGATASEDVNAAAPASDFDTSKDISVVSREDGSGTRGAFIELFGIEVKNDDGSKQDMTTKEAEIAKQTDVMMTSVANNPYSIGYISMGSMNDTVKGVNIDGVAPNPENVKNGTYTVSRPFNIVTKGEAAGLAKDFIDYILSKEGQEVVAGGYIAVDEAAAAYAGSKPEGKIVVAGSSSVTPIMEKLKEAYIVINPNAQIEIQQSDSAAGITAAIDGTCDIGMASRDLKDDEVGKLTQIQIALDGITVIVNNGNPAADMTKDQVKAIYTGEATAWNAL